MRWCVKRLCDAPFRHGGRADHLFLSCVCCRINGDWRRGSKYEWLSVACQQSRPREQNDFTYIPNAQAQPCEGCLKQSKSHVTQNTDSQDLLYVYYCTVHTDKVLFTLTTGAPCDKVSEETFWGTFAHEMRSLSLKWPISPDMCWIFCCFPSWRGTDRKWTGRRLLCATWGQGFTPTAYIHSLRLRVIMAFTFFGGHFYAFYYIAIVKVDKKCGKREVALTCSKWSSWPSNYRHLFLRAFRGMWPNHSVNGYFDYQNTTSTRRHIVLLNPFD